MSLCISCIHTVSNAFVKPWMTITSFRTVASALSPARHASVEGLGRFAVSISQLSEREGRNHSRTYIVHINVHSWN